MTDIVDLELRSCVVLSHGLGEDLHIPKSIAKDKVFGALDVRLFPIEAVVLKLVATGHRLDGKIDS